MFTEKGRDTLTKYLQNLTKLYLKKDIEYPLKIGIVLGIPLFGWANTITSREDLMGRIKAYAQLLGVDEITIQQGSSLITLKLKEKVI
jgi:hypothetical protein